MTTLDRALLASVVVVVWSVLVALLVLGEGQPVCASRSWRVNGWEWTVCVDPQPITVLTEAIETP